MEMVDVGPEASLLTRSKIEIFRLRLIPHRHALFLLATTICTVCVATASPASAQFICGPTGSYSLIGINISISVAGSSASGGSVACGNNTNAAGTNSVALGAGAAASGNLSLGLGSASTASGNAAIAIGGNSAASQSDSLALGINANVSGSSAVGIGNGAIVSGTNATAVGVGASATGLGSVAFGQGASAGFSNSVAIGVGTATTANNQIALGGATNVLRVAGITSAASVSAQVGPISIVTTDSSGNLAAANPATLFAGRAFDPTSINNELTNHEGRIDRLEHDTAQARRGVAAAMSLTGGANVPSGKTVAMSANWGTFGGENAFGTSAAALVGDGVYVSGGLAVTSSKIGGRAGLMVAWQAMRDALIVLLFLSPATSYAQQEISGIAAPAHENGRSVAPPQAVALTRQILLCIDDALRSGNFTVMRDLAAPSLRETQTSADLAAALAPLRLKKIELLAAAILDPQFSEAVIVRDGTEMRLIGYLPTAPLRISFAFVLHAVDGIWQLSNVEVDLKEIKIPATTAAPPSGANAIRPPLL